jgi:RNA-splicing ligase RtcB
MNNLNFKGAYNTLEIKINVIEEELVKKIYKLVNNPDFAGTKMVGMPDCHEGAGAFVGFTMAYNDDTPVAPNIVGVDINCGVMTCNIGKIDVDLPRLDKFVHENIPAGFFIRNSPHRMIEESGSFRNEVLEVAEKVGVNPDTALNSIGTLGGGNHFIEAGKDDNGNLWITVHTGSRNFGLKVCAYHQRKAVELTGSTDKELAALPPGEALDEYLSDMAVAQRYAELNRKAIMDEILRHVYETYHTDAVSPKWNSYGQSLMWKNLEIVHSNHNYIDLENKIIRKGAVAAYKDQRLVIPFNMRDGIMIARGLGNPDWNFSAPHGSGRILSRSKAKSEISMEEYAASMEGIFSTTVNPSTIDEAPMAYKDTAVILEAVKETLRPELFIKPVYSFKASS